MRYILLLITLLLSLPTQAQEPDTTTLSVVSWNIQMLPNFFRAFSSSLRMMQGKRVPWIVEYIKSQDFDVIVFQEVFDVDCKARLRRQLKELYPYQVKPINQGRLTSNGILIMSKYRMEKLGHVVYAKGVGSDKMAAKGCVLVEVKKDSAVFQIAGTHLQSGNNEAAQQHRDQQYKDIYNLLEKYRKAGIPQLVAGDMNTRKSATARYERMLKSMDVLDFPLDEAAPYTIDGNNSWKSKDHEPVQLDYIFLRKNESNSSIQTQKVLRPKKEYKGRVVDLADHYGVWGRVLVW